MQSHATGLALESNLVVAFGDEHAQALWMGAESYRRRQFEGFAVDPRVGRPRAGPDLELLAAELERMPAAPPWPASASVTTWAACAPVAAETANTPRDPVSSRRRWDVLGEAART